MKTICIECSKNKSIENKEGRRKNSREYHKMRYNSDPIYKFIKNVRNNVKNSIIRGGYKKNSKTEKIVGMEYSSFMSYIESMFRDNMSWDNYGEWHLDHKIPISCGSSESDIIKLCHYSNYQPLWALENMSKGNRYSN